MGKDGINRRLVMLHACFVLAPALFGGEVPSWTRSLAMIEMLVLSGKWACSEGAGAATPACGRCRA